MCFATLLAAAPMRVASGADFDWFGGDYTGLPAVIAAPNTLNILVDVLHTFNAVGMTNNGTVQWTGGEIGFASGSIVTNNAAWNVLTDNAFSHQGGSGSTFTNNGSFSKLAGAGDTVIGSVSFVNNGELKTDSGRIVYAGGLASFRAGTSFTGSGSHRVTNNASFVGLQTIAAGTNVELSVGNFSGNAAQVEGILRYSGGTVSGTWTIANNSTLAYEGGTAKAFDAAALNNAGNLNWSGSDLRLSSGSTLTNTGVMTVSSDHNIAHAGGAGVTVTNSGTFRKSGGTGITSIEGATFVNNGIVDAQTGTLRYASGVATFNDGSQLAGSAGKHLISNNATFSGLQKFSGDVELSGGIATGTSAVLEGALRFTGGTLTGGWTIKSGSVLSHAGAGDKTLVTAFISNSGIVNWDGSDLRFQDGSSFTNLGTLNATSNHNFVHLGGQASTFTNSGTFRKTTGTGTTAINATTFSNEATGTIAVETGTFAMNVVMTQLGTIDVANGARFETAGLTNQGTLSGSGELAANIVNTGVIAPGASPGTLTIAGNLVQGSAGRVLVELVSPANHDVIAVTGNVALTGDLEILPFNSALRVGDSFTVLTADGELSGRFTRELSKFGPGVEFAVTYDYDLDQVRIGVTAVPEPEAYALMLAGLGLIGWAARRRSRNA